MLYKLDLGIDHVLIDEAQDTSPKQWEIIKTIVAEFPPGGARDNVSRTMFAVGDEKQSIFSFQGAAPLAFADSRRSFRASCSARPRARSSQIEKLPYSFRSGADGARRRRYGVQAAGGVSRPDRRSGRGPCIRPLPDAAPGVVEIWDIIGPDAKDAGKEGWDAPFDTTSETSPAIKLARQDRPHGEAWCAPGTRPRDVLILVRQRGPLFEAVIRALKREGIAVAGADRLVLTEHIAVMDLMVLGDALLLPDDDLALATVLKSPLFGLDEEQLFKLAYDRNGPLRAMLAAESAATIRCSPRPTARSTSSAQAARQLTPFAFYAHVLGPLQGRKRILARLGVEANDPLDEFLNLALDYERRETPSLQGFLDWIRVGAERGQARHGDGARRGAGDDRARRQGPRSQERHPDRRHHDAAGRRLSAAAVDAPLNDAAPGATALIWGGAKGPRCRPDGGCARARRSTRRATNTGACSMSA